MDYLIMLSNLRHDIKNHLTAIKAFSQLINSEANKLSATDIVNYAKKIDARVDQITTLLDNTKKDR